MEDGVFRRGEFGRMPEGMLVRLAAAGDEGAIAELERRAGVSPAGPVEQISRESSWGPA